MTGSLIDLLAPEAQSLLGIAALVVAALGIIIWAAGVRIARVAVAILLGLVAAAISAWLLPSFISVASATAALLGFIVGLLAGALGFRLLQGVTLAMCLGLAVAGMYYRWHVAPLAVTNSAVAPTAPDASNPVPASDLLIRGPLADSAPATTLPISDIATFIKKLHERWNAIRPRDQRRMLAAGIGTAAVVLLLAFGFARQTTWVVSAILGALMMIAGSSAAAHVYVPSFHASLPISFLLRYGAIALLAALGMLLQWFLFWPNRRDRSRPRSKALADNKPPPSAMGKTEK